MIEVVYLPNSHEIFSRKIEYKASLKVSDALKISGVLDLYPEVITLQVGIYSNIVTQNTVLNDGDRVEIYRQLMLDPKERRRQRAK